MALARGLASSRALERKKGHIRVSGDCVLHMPQPLQPTASLSSVSALQRNLQRNELDGSGGQSAEFARAGSPRWPDDLARIEQVLRVEDLLDSLEDAVQFAVLRPQKGRPGHPVAVFSADRAAHREDGRIQIAGQCFELCTVGRRRRRQKRTQMNLAGRRMRIERRRHFVALKHLLRRDEKLPQRRRRHRDIFDDRRRAASAP